ncbi:hypothetical protein BDN67DRAFT_258699 [Paxillus ammoniavirescens]|nr:hypothetical protein BDN67DRAFT_258699 [Paxillus ammoniavirescens]
MGASSSTSSTRENMRWAAPELFGSGTAPPMPPSLLSDIYSFGSVMFQVRSGQLPYPNLRNDRQVLVKMMMFGFTPSHPLSLPIADEHWGFIQRRWAPLREDGDCQIVKLSSSTHAPYTSAMIKELLVSETVDAQPLCCSVVLEGAIEPYTLIHNNLLIHANQVSDPTSSSLQGRLIASVLAVEGRSPIGIVLVLHSVKRPSGVDAHQGLIHPEGYVSTSYGGG